VHGGCDVVVSVLAVDILVANLALDGVCLDERQVSDDTWLLAGHAVAAV
jgi:hypothetical protein